MKNRKSDNIEVIEDTYSVSYQKKITDYNRNSDEKIYDEVIRDIFDIINREAIRGRYYIDIDIYSINYRRNEFYPDTPEGSKKKERILAKVKNFLIEKGFKCKRNGIRLDISWNSEL